MNKTLLFIGPSYPIDIIRAEWDIVCHPPARRGDIERAVNEGFTCIVLIDSYLIYEYPPSPREVWSAIQCGVRVFGAASMGALRAVELRHNGMIGVGWVYKHYLDGTITADDEVVVVIDPRKNSSLTVPLVRVRFALEHWQTTGIVCKEHAEEAIRRLKNIPFERRSAKTVLDELVLAGIHSKIANELFSEQYDVKALDTVACLRAAGVHQLGNYGSPCY